ncbi:MAG: glycosyltransferase family A protein, partial [Solirubrobacteraceae bacterium]
DLIVFLDDDVDAPPGWLYALLSGVRASPDYDVFGGPIRPRLEGGGPWACGLESAPITALYLAAGGRIRYLAAVGLDHRRTPADATVRRRCAIGIVLVAQTVGRLREAMAERRP